MQTIILVAFVLSSFFTSGAFGLADFVRSPTLSVTVASGCTAPRPTSRTYDPTVIQCLQDSLVERFDPRQAPAAPPPALPAQPLPATETSSAAPTTSIIDSTNPLSNPLADPPVAAPANPAIPAALPALPPAPPPAPLLTPSVTPPVTSAPISTHGLSVFVTVQWLETWIDGTSRTWLPHTITIHQEAPTDAAPPPGKGQIGMGTLTGKAGVTQTIVEGSAETVGPKWKVGAVAAMGIGMAGIL